MKHAKLSLVAGAAVLGALSLSACATKEYVDQSVLRVDQMAQGTQQQLDATKSEIAARDQAQDGQIAQVDATARDALQRATAAGKLAEGKFLYSMVLSDDGVKFPVNAHELSPEAQQRLAQLVDKLKSENRNVYLEIQGHTDATGAPVYNEKLGEERAETVRRYLSKNGVALNRMATISYGEDAPVADNHTKEGRAQNRRVVVVVLA